MSARLPMLPGFSPNGNIGKDRFHKSQALIFNNNVANIDTSKPGIGGASDDSKQQETSLKNSAYPTAEGQPAQPAWLAFDRQVLRYYAHFEEDVHGSAVENYRVRYCAILFYLEDDTMQITEKATKNSGLNQGTLVRRHRFPKPSPDDDQFYTVEDMNVGTEVIIYGRKYNITGCDQFTADFLAKLNIDVGEFVEPPPDPHTETMRSIESAMSTTRPYQPLDTRQGFVKHHPQVLRFYCLWDDSANDFGDKRYLVLLYYLADETVEISEVLGPNSGRDGGTFFKRARLPKDAKAALTPLGETAPRTVLNIFTKGHTDRNSRHVLDTSTMKGGIEKNHYTDLDFEVGSTIQMLGRELLLCDCDDFTKNYYTETYGVKEFNVVDVTEPPAEVPVREIPPHNGIGTEEDSLVSVNKLILSPPRKSPGKHFSENSKGCNILRFNARLDTEDELETDRKFVISFFLENDTMSIYEHVVTNAGRTAGTFLERGKYKTPEGAPFEATAFLKGEKVTVQKRTFVVLDADEYTYKLQAQNKFPHSDAEEIVENLKQLSNEEKEGLTNEKCVMSLIQPDGTVSESAMRSILKSSKVLSHEQEEEMLVRAFLDKETKLVNYKDFLEQIGAGEKPSEEVENEENQAEASQ